MIGERATYLEAGHPSPLSVKSFLGCGHFKEINRLLTERGEKPIDWSL
jgi:uracil-DNA glycosylase